MKYRLTCLLVLATIACFAQEIGIQLYSVRNQNPADIKATLAMIKSWGITQLEGGGTYGLSNDEFLKLCQESGLKLVSIGADFKELETDVPKVIERAKAMNVKYVVCYWLPHEGDVFNKADADRAIAVFNKAGKQLAGSGLSLCYHPHGYEFVPETPGRTLFDYMVASTDKRYLSFEMDVFWVKQGGVDPASLLKKYTKRFKLLHLKDRKIGTPNSTDGHADVETNVVLGTGDVNIAEVMRVAKKIGIVHYFIEDESSRVITQVPESVRYLKSLKN
jgi:sugar phosphate isomerase/epimerase